MYDLRRGHDGKHYPAHPLSADERRELVIIAHGLRHSRGSSVRQIVAQLDEEYGISRSVGSVSSYLNDHDCPLCSDSENPHLDKCSGADSAHLNNEPECSGVQSGQLDKDGAPEVARERSGAPEHPGASGMLHVKDPGR